MTAKFLPLAVLVLALAACKQQPGQAPAADAKPQPPVSAPATAPGDGQAGVVQQTAETPQLQVQTVDGKAYDLASHRGQWVVINFWATWCAPCLQEMPELSALHAMRSNVEVIGLAYEDIELGEMQAFLKEHPVAYPIAIVDTYSPPKDFATPRGLPMTYLIGPDGKVAKQFLGPVNAHDIEQAITAAGGKVG